MRPHTLRSVTSSRGFVGVRRQSPRLAPRDAPPLDRLHGRPVRPGGELRLGLLLLRPRLRDGAEDLPIRADESDDSAAEFARNHAQPGSRHAVIARLAPSPWRGAVFTLGCTGLTRLAGFPYSLAAQRLRQTERRRSTKTIGFTGGEPFLERRRFISVIGALQKFPPQTDIHVLTNGRACAFADVAGAWAQRSKPAPAV
jgi:hypothetical protein